MADEPRRSGRATKGQHKNASSSPAPIPKPAAKAAAGKRSKKATSQQPASDEDEDEEDQIRCICGNDNPKDKRAFIGCDACSVWQHNVCMGMPDDEDEVGEHYFCERCRPEEHAETLEALERGEKIWEARNKIYQAEKKMSKNRKAKTGKAGWLKKELKQEATPEQQPAETKETGNKRKRESEVPQLEAQAEAAPEPAAEKPARGPRQEKRRKSSGADKKAAEDPETAIISIEKLPADRKKIAQQLSKIIQDGVQEVATSGWRIPDGQTPKSIGEGHASKIEYALQMNHEGPANKDYAQQFRMLNANLKQNRSLLDGLLSGSITADELATMSSNEMASDKLQQERAAMKAEADRQATIDQKDSGPRYRRTHKGDELVEDEDAVASSAPVSRPVRHSIADAEMTGMGSESPTRKTVSRSPTQQMHAPLSVDTAKRQSSGDLERRSSNQNFDVNSIWAKTAQSPTQTTARPMQMPPRRRSSVMQQADGAKEDADVDRMLADDNDTYSPADYEGGEAIVWRGKIVQSSGDSEPTVNARFVAGRDVSSTIAWKDLLPSKLTIDGRLQIPKAEEYLCGLQWSSSSDVSVLALTPYDDAAAFNTVFEYFQTRQRYAVVNKDKPPMIKDLYIIPIDSGAKLPEHVEMLEHCTIKQPVEERLLLATFVVARPPADTSSNRPATATDPQQQQPQQNTNGHHLPQHLRASTQGPQGSPLQTSGPQFSPAQPQSFGPGTGTGSPIPPNPYSTTPSQHVSTPPYPSSLYSAMPQTYPQQPTPQVFAPQPSANPLAAQILGDLINAPTAQSVLQADPGIGEDKLRNLERILRENEGCRTDIGALAARLGAGGGGGGS